LFKVWQASSQKTWNVEAEFAPIGTNNLVTATSKFVSDGISMVTELTPAGSEVQLIPLKKGWNLISSYLNPDSVHISFESIIHPVSNNVSFVKDDIGGVFVIGDSYNSLVNWNVHKGFKMYCAFQGHLPILGAPIVTKTTSIPIKKGWQIIPFYGRKEEPIVDALAGLNGKIEAVKDNWGRVYFPDLRINTIGLMEPGQGYYLKSKFTSSLFYPEYYIGSHQLKYDKLSGPNLIVSDSTEHFKLSEGFNTGVNATLVFLAERIHNLIQYGDEIGVFSPDGLLCGAGKFLGENLAITVWGDDPIVEGIQGMMNDEPYLIKLWRKATNTKFQVEFLFANSQGFFNEDDIVIMPDIKLLVNAFSLGKDLKNIAIYPNPTSDFFLIQSYQPIDGPVFIRLFDQSRKLIFQKTLDFGMNSMKDQFIDVKNLTPGVYNVQLFNKAGQFGGRVVVVK
jgi:hypothetical protein